MSNQFLISLKESLDTYARVCLKIRTKDGSFKPFVLNQAQTHLHKRLQEQLKARGYVRAVILKGRQQGVSTYTSGRFFHNLAFNRGLKSFVLTHDSKSTSTLFDMAKRFHEHLPSVMAPSISKNNSNELVFDKLGSGFKVSTAGSPGTGRGDTLQLFHGSEVAFWPNEEEIVTGALQAVPLAKGSEIILESTANGAKGLFYKMCKQANEGVGDYELIFIPWYWQDEYRRPTENIQFSNSDREYQNRYGLDEEQMTWRHYKQIELGVHKFRQEYPANFDEAFQVDIEGALWTVELLARQQTREVPKDVSMLRIVVGVDPAVTSNKNSDETGIVVVGQADDGNIYVLDDLSGKFTTDQWARRVISAYNTYEASAIIAETNQGGDLVLNAIRAVDPTANIKGKHVSVSKTARHEPVSALYARGVVYHVGNMADLETQMTTWNPIKSKNSPDRVDALTLAVAELGLQKPKREFQSFSV